ncbi:telomere length regulation TEL2 family protein [Aspergillus saccharolyticus JOP 1030-1]|uniref:Telomere length regulation protein conserved domain-containing protein n=1 Tax=Aspergillus saccharolyticus JOP 1030-1 TaxID=1450539 RepID=A0A318ZNM3_9EURO|nr:hypothetical protein BP01DRAFT_412956 [Aspergillus saccharolyticus JOP 1030-1]PYH49199.1 hypothetical protein BP01DRAFT_412956 [Aspergillus saccharolyticus JOP 1030-1]
MDSLLTAVKTVTPDRETLISAAAEPSPAELTSDKRVVSELDWDVSSPESILARLKFKPDQDQLAQILAVIDPSSKTNELEDFDIRIPAPKTAQILNVLVTVTIPDHWDSLCAESRRSKSSSKLRAALLRCLSSVAGISCLLTQLRSLIAACRSSAQEASASGHQAQARDILSVICALLEPDDLMYRLYAEIESLYHNPAQKQVAWKELLSHVAASRVLSTAAEAISLIKDLDGTKSLSWVGDGPRYASWLGTNICLVASKISLDKEDAWKAVALLTGRSLSLGYTDQLVREIYVCLLINDANIQRYGLLFDHLRPNEQLAFIEAIFRDIEKKHFSGITPGEMENDSQEVLSAVAALCSFVTKDRPQIQAQIVEWLSKGQGGSIHTTELRRAIVASFANMTDLMVSLVTKSLDYSGDTFYIQHAPIRCQEANTQIILLTCGYLQQTDPLEVMRVGRSGIFLNAVSNRLAASSGRARFLGMLIGTAISSLIEPAGKGMRFDLEEMESDEAKWYLSLLTLQDSVGYSDSIKVLKEATSGMQRTPSRKVSFVKGTGPSKKVNMRSTKIVAIEEVEDSEEESEDEDLVPYEKPDEDFSDDDEDPTLVQRNKPTAPVYIRDLITYLRDTENVERYELAVSTAPSLIRRKTGFGTELAENIEELALVVVSLQEQGKLSKFLEYQLQSMIALIVSQPLKMGHWFAALFFDGDLSQPQRSAVLTALGLSARELAGNGEADAKNLGLPSLPDASFPSKKLPSSLEAFYSTDSPLASLTRSMAQASLEPLAAHAEESRTGPNALKVRTFSTRMEVEKRRQQREAQRQKSTIKDLYKVLAQGFFFPLKGRFEMMMMQFGSSTAPSYNPFYVPHLLCLFIQTLTLILSSMGPHTPYLPNLTEETLSFLLSLHGRPLADDPSILSALFALFLAIVDLNVVCGTTGEERLVTEFATQVVELRDWVGGVFDRTPAVQDASDPREQVRTLAAGVMVKLGEVMERYQGRLMGVNSGFRY